MKGARASQGPVIGGVGERLEEAASVIATTLAPRSVNRPVFLEAETLASLLKLLREDLTDGKADSARKKLPVTRMNRMKKKQCLTFIGSVQMQTFLRKQSIFAYIRRAAQAYLNGRCKAGGVGGAQADARVPRPNIMKIDESLKPQPKSSNYSFRVGALEKCSVSLED